MHVRTVRFNTTNAVPPYPGTSLPEYRDYYIGYVCTLLFLNAPPWPSVRSILAINAREAALIFSSSGSRLLSRDKMPTWRDEYLVSIKDAEGQNPINGALIEACVSPLTPLT